MEKNEAQKPIFVKITPNRIRRFKHLKNILAQYDRDDPDTIKALLHLWRPSVPKWKVNNAEGKLYQYVQQVGKYVYLRRSEVEIFFRWCRENLDRITIRPFFELSPVFGGPERVRELAAEFLGVPKELVVSNELGMIGVWRYRDPATGKKEIQWLDFKAQGALAAWCWQHAAPVDLKRKEK